MLLEEPLHWLRKNGWNVAVHNDYLGTTGHCTFWLFVKGDRCIKVEGMTSKEVTLLELAVEKAREYDNIGKT